MDLSSKAKSAGRKPRLRATLGVDAIKDDYVAEVNKITVGDVVDFTTSSAPSSTRRPSIASRATSTALPTPIVIITGGTYDDSTGYFIQPTTIVCNDPRGDHGRGNRSGSLGSRLRRRGL